MSRPQTNLYLALTCLILLFLPMNAASVHEGAFQAGLMPH